MTKNIVIGPLPPPVHGMSKNLNIFVNDIGRENCIVLDISPGTLTRTFKYHLKKLFKVAKNLAKLAFYCSNKCSRRVYICPDGGLGLIYTTMFVTVAKMFGLECYLHHRSFQYIHNKSALMHYIQSYKRNLVTNIFLSKVMQTEFVELYPNSNTSKFTIIGNQHYVEPMLLERLENQSEKVTWVIGFLSNISFDKGIVEVLNTAKELNKTEINIQLKIAGPFESENERAYLETFSSQNVGLVEYLGPVYNENKVHFYDSIDFFLFPSMYKNEAQPNVIFEAQSRAVPTIAYSIACLRDDISDKNGLLINLEEDFVKKAAKFILLTIREGQYDQLSNRTLETIAAKAYETKCSYKTLVSTFQD